MALTAQEEALVRQLLDEQAAILSLAGSEATILSKLGATKVTLSDLTAVSTVSGSDLLLMRQGTTDKSLSASIFGAYAAASVPDATDTVKGKIELATNAEVQTGTDTTQAVTPAGLSARTATDARTGVVELATDAEAQAGTDATRVVTPDNLGATVIGIGQTWTDVGASRAFATNYTNSTGRAIQVNVNISFPSGSAAELLVNGSIVSRGASGGASTESALTAIVQPGIVYRVNSVAGTPAFSTWKELR